MKHEFPITRTANPKEKPDPNTLKFGETFTDHMFIMEYTDGKGWHDGRIVPYGPLSLSPAATCLHYGQEMFEGLKAYKTKEGKIQLFRPDMNAKRTNVTNERMCIPTIDEEIYVDAIKALVNVEKDWIPDIPNTALYIRPFIIGDSPELGVKPAKHYIFGIITCPVGPYYANGLSPTKIYVEEEFVRAVMGGTGYAKIGGNYAGALKAQMKAHEKGYDQVLWLDGIERKYVEEIGTSNAFFVICDEIITAPLAGTILPGITRNSVITLLKEWGLHVSERKLSIEDVFEAGEDGTLKEVFATGTAAVISPVGELSWGDRKITVNKGEIGSISQKLYDTLYGMQTGLVEDKHNWVFDIK
ncbi:MAG: branched-chain amino acid aminotransferase [Peptostreptococcaceae bacterium]|nr:branched-chain amino acid aminotransferase [Peptostreptococcaceae bacterium]